jgi:mono/diheme cytochrome c family protein
MKSRFLLCGLLIGILGLLIFTGRSVSAQHMVQLDFDIARGGALYDNWFAALETSPPAGNMPLWERQTSNTRSGADTWRCSTCHGWDYQGKDGAYRSGSNYTGFPGIYDTALEMTVDDIKAHLSGQKDPLHDFSSYLDEKSMDDLAGFLHTALVSDEEYIDKTTFAVSGGNIETGKSRYNQSCSSCHGEDGSAITLRYEGSRTFLGDLANIDPWRFLHKTRFGTPGTDMAIGYDLGWTAEDGRDVLTYAKTLPHGQELIRAEAISNSTAQPARQPGGPANNFFTGLLTALGAMATSLGFALLVGGVFVGLILVFVWFARGQK